MDDRAELDRLRKMHRLAELEKKAGSGQRFSASNMVKNVPESAANLVKDTIAPFLSPLDTAKALGNLGEGVIDVATDNAIGDEDKSAYAQEAWNMIKQRYGGRDELLNTIETDPVGFLSDAAALFTGPTGIGVRMTGKGAGVLHALEYADPLVAAGRAVKAGPGRAFAKWADPNDMMQEVLKFNTTDDYADRVRWADTALRERIVKSSDLTGRFSEKIDSLTESLTAAIDSADPNAAIPVDRVLRGLDALESDKTGFKAEAAKDRKLISEFKEDFLVEHGDRQYVTARELQDFKTDLYDKVYKRRKANKKVSTKDDIYGTVARGAKEGLEDAVPEVAALNERLGELLDARSPLMQKWNRIDNRSKFGLTQMLMTGIGAGAGEFQGAAIGLGAGMLLSPEMVARAAVALDEMLRNGAKARLVDNAVLRGLTRGQVMQIQKLAGRYLETMQTEQEGQEPTWQQERPEPSSQKRPAQ